METDLVPVRFKVPHLPYGPGEVAGFDAKLAARLVKDGSAEYLQGFKPPQEDKGPPAKIVKK